MFESQCLSHECSSGQCQHLALLGGLGRPARFWEHRDPLLPDGGPGLQGSLQVLGRALASRHPPLPSPLLLLQLLCLKCPVLLLLQLLIDLSPLSSILLACANSIYIALEL